MNQAIEVIGGADGPTVVFLSGGLSAGTVLFPMAASLLFSVLLYFALYRHGKRKTLCLTLSALSVIAADQYVKLLTRSLSLGESAAFLPDIVRLRRVHNYGAAWSSLSGARWLLIVITAAGMGALVWLLLRIVRHPLGQWSIIAVVAGGIGNLIDRAAAGYVVDMFDLQFISFPVFNVADCFVVCGTVCAMLYYLVYYPKSDEGAWKNRHGNGGTDGGAGA